LQTRIATQPINCAASKVKTPQRVLESRVYGARVHKVREPSLKYSPQALEQRGVDQQGFVSLDFDHSPNCIPDYFVIDLSYLGFQERG